jgi:hypothetical protein
LANITNHGPVGTTFTITGGDGNDAVELDNVLLASPASEFPHLVSVAGGPGRTDVWADRSTCSLAVTGTEAIVDLILGNTGPTTVTGGSLAAVTAINGSLDGNLLVQALRRDGVANLNSVGGLTMPHGSLLVRSAGSANLTVRSGAPLNVVGDTTVAAVTGDATVQVNDQFLTRRLAVTSLGGDSRYQQTETAAGQGLQTYPGAAVTVSAFKDAEFDQEGGSVDITGPLTVSGQTTGRLTQNGVSTTTTVAGPVRVAGGAAEAVLDIEGDAWTGKEATTVTSPGRAVVAATAGTAARFEQNVAVQGGSGVDTLVGSSSARFLKNLSVNLGAGGGQVNLGPGSTVGGALSVTGGTGADTVSLAGVTVTGSTRVVTGGGADTLTVDQGAAFGGTFYADLGAGADTIAIGQTTGASGPVTFSGKVTILAGAGNDNLRLGRAAAAGGDAHCRPAFVAAGNVIDGGSGINLFDDEAAAITGSVAPTHWTDPTP